MEKQLAIEPAATAVEADSMGAGDEHDLDEESDSDESDETNRWEPTDVSEEPATISFAVDLGWLADRVYRRSCALIIYLCKINRILSHRTDQCQITQMLHHGQRRIRVVSAWAKQRPDR